MLRCPHCDTKLGKAAAVSFTSSRRVERYWCDSCRCYQKASVARDFDREDQFEDYTGPILWDLGALPSSSPFSARNANVA